MAGRVTANREQVVCFVGATREVLYHDLPDTFAVRSDRPHLWLQRLCAWTMRKLGAHARDQTVTMTRHVIHADTFMERLFKQRRELAREFNYEPDEMLIGAEDYEELMGSPEILQTFSFDAEYCVGRNLDAHPYGKVMGLKVRVIPWMRGVLVMPRLR